MFSCCDNLAAGDKDLAYDCKTSLPGGGTCTDEVSCKENYQEGLKVMEYEARMKALLEKKPSTLGTVVGYLIVGSCVFGLFCSSVMKEANVRSFTN